MLTDHDFEKINELLAKRPPVNSCRDNCIYKETAVHDEEHAVLKRWIENDINRNLRNEKIRATVIGGLILSTACSVGTGAIYMVGWVRDHLK